MASTQASFRFDAEQHIYFDLDGGTFKHITELLTVSGWTNERWFEEEHSARGRAVHRLTAEYDLRALDPDDCMSQFRPYLLAHVVCTEIVKPTWRHIETPFVHSKLRFGGRPDRVALVYDALSVWEVKSGQIDKSHAIQTALQALVIEEEAGVPAEYVHRYVEYVKPDGRYRIDRHLDERDFHEARRIIKRYVR
jgi:hypothetical protein